MNDKLTDNNETQEVVAKPIFRIKERQEEVAKTDVIVGQSIDSVANDGNEIDLEIEEKVNVKSQNGTKSVAKEESNDNNAAQENFEKITAIPVKAERMMGGNKYFLSPRRNLKA